MIDGQRAVTDPSDTAYQFHIIEIPWERQSDRVCGQIFGGKGSYRRIGRHFRQGARGSGNIVWIEWNHGVPICLVAVEAGVLVGFTHIGGDDGSISHDLGILIISGEIQNNTRIGHCIGGKCGEGR